MASQRRAVGGWAGRGEPGGRDGFGREWGPGISDDGCAHHCHHHGRAALGCGRLQRGAGFAVRVERERGGVDEVRGEFCYANCDNSTTPPVLNVIDFQCFLSKFAGGDPYANCDGSTVPPVLSANDFMCFLNSYGAGCS